MLSEHLHCHWLAGWPMLKLVFITNHFAPIFCWLEFPIHWGFSRVLFQTFHPSLECHLVVFWNGCLKPISLFSPFSLGIQLLKLHVKYQMAIHAFQAHYNNSRTVKHPYKLNRNISLLATLCPSNNSDSTSSIPINLHWSFLAPF